VIATGNRIVVRVNGTTTANFEDPKRTYAKGHLALQVWHPQTVVQFRKIEIKAFPGGKPAPPADVQPLRDLVAAKEKSRDVVKLRVEAGKDSQVELVAAEIELTEARVRLAEAEGDRAAVVERLQELVTLRQSEKKLVVLLVEAGRQAVSALTEADARIADAEARLVEAKKRVP
jgi:hypothetical protein